MLRQGPWASVSIVAACLIAGATEISARAENNAPAKIVIIAAAVTRVLEEYGHGAVCVVAWDQATEQYRVRGYSGKGRYLQASTHGAFAGSQCRDFPGFPETRQRFDQEVMWLTLGLGRRCAAGYCVSVAMTGRGVGSPSTWNYRVKCPEGRCQGVDREFVAEE